MNIELDNEGFSFGVQIVGFDLYDLFNGTIGQEVSYCFKWVVQRLEVLLTAPVSAKVTSQDHPPYDLNGLILGERREGVSGHIAKKVAPCYLLARARSTKPSTDAYQLTNLFVAMNKLPTAKRAAIIRVLCEGNSIRATCRLSGAAKATVLSLLVEVGEFCSHYQDHVLRNLPTVRVEADEIWAFVGAKQRRATKAGDGDIWTFTAIDADTKLMITWLVGPRSVENATAFMVDLRSRMSRRIQLTTDGNAMYETAVRAAFPWDEVDWAMLVKQYGAVEGGQDAARRYSPPVCTGAVKVRKIGQPDHALVSTSYVERANLSNRMQQRRFTRLTNAFSKKAENHAHAVSLYFMYYNFCRAHATLTKAHPKHYPTTPAMAAGVADHVWTVEELVGLLDPTRPLQSN